MGLPGVAVVVAAMALRADFFRHHFAGHSFPIAIFVQRNNKNLPAFFGGPFAAACVHLRNSFGLSCIWLLVSETYPSRVIVAMKIRIHSLIHGSENIQLAQCV